MLHRYSTLSDNNKLVRKAKIYVKEEHKIKPEQIDADARWIIDRLTACGFKAYIVGGAVRDLLVGRQPKDFDVATDAFPRQIRRIFKRSRIIGRRFRLVHVYFGKEKIIEVSTFRSKDSIEINNHYGTMGEDAFRRDFSLNALYYCPKQEYLIDYVDGFKDIKKKKLKVLNKPQVSFIEDPVRMIRAIKYAAMCGINLDSSLKKIIKKLKNHINDCSKERLTEEFYKILFSGNSYTIFKSAYELKILEALIPNFIGLYEAQDKKISHFYRLLEALDKRILAGEDLSRGDALTAISKDIVGDQAEWRKLELEPMQKELRNLFLPLIPANKDLLTITLKLYKHLRRNRPRHKGRNQQYQLAQGNA